MKRSVIKVIIIIITYTAFITITDIGCHFRAIVGIPCPTCGVTRALIELLRRNIIQSLKYNFMAIPLVLAAFAILYIELINNKKIIFKFAMIIITLNFIIYILKLVFMYCL